MIYLKGIKVETVHHTQKFQSCKYTFHKFLTSQKSNSEGKKIQNVPVSIHILEEKKIGYMYMYKVSR